MNLNRTWWLWTKAPPSEETKWTSGQEPNHPLTLMINLRHQVDATRKTISHQAQAATWTDKGRLLKIKSQKETLQLMLQNPGQKGNHTANAAEFRITRAPASAKWASTTNHKIRTYCQGTQTISKLRSN